MGINLEVEKARTEENQKPSQKKQERPGANVNVNV